VTTAQQPLPSGLGFATTAREAVANHDLTDKTMIVTGGYSGLGLEVVRALLEAGANVIVPARTRAKAEENLTGLRVELAALDLFAPASIDAFAAKFLASKRPLHGLINCAGIMAAPLERDPRGYESQFATNHLGHFQLTLRLWPALVEAYGARVVSVSSRGHRFSSVNFEDTMFDRRPYDKWKAYGQSKSANVLFAVALDARGSGQHVRAFAVHPGTIHTDLGRHMTEDDLVMMGATRGPDGKLATAFNTTMKTPDQGAATIAWCGVNRQLEGKGGVYCEDCDISPAVPADAPIGPGVRPWAIDPALAETLWTASETWTGVRLPG